MSFFKKLIILFLLLLAAYLLLPHSNSVFAQYGCGDGNCDDPWETCANCPHDCGLCPVPSPVPSGFPVPSVSPLPSGASPVPQAVSCGWWCCPGYSAPCDNDVKGYEKFCWPDCSSSGAQVCYREPDCYMGECINCSSCGCGTEQHGWEVPSCPAGMCGTVVCNDSTGACYSTCQPGGSCGTQPSPSPPPGALCTCIPQAPQAPTLNTVVVHSASATLSWNNSVSWGKYCCDAASYTAGVCNCTWGSTCVAGTNNSGTTCNRNFKFYFDDDSNVFDGPLATYTLGTSASSQAVSGLTAGTTYYWTVCSNNTYQVVCAATQSFIPTNVPPSAPTSLVASSECLPTVDLSWSHSGWGTQVDGTYDNRFYVYMRKGGAWQLAFNTTNTYYNNFNLTSIWPGASGNYEWYVRASNNNGNFTDPNTYANSLVGSFSRGNSAPTAPTNPIPANGAEISANYTSLNWTAPTNWGCNLADPDFSERHYKVYLKPGSDPADADIVDGSCSPFTCAQNCSNLSAGSTACSPITHLTWNTIYHWRVKACNDSAESYCNSSVWQFTPTAGAWWQVRGGSIYAQTSINDILPSDDVYLMTDINAGRQHGIAVYGQVNGLDLGSFCGAAADEDCVPENVAQDSSDWNVNSSYDGLTYDYDWWVRHLRDEDKVPGDFNGDNPNSDGIYVSADSVTTTGNWNVANKKVVVLINGDFNINHRISVGTNGGFLMVVAKDRITVANSLGGNINNGDVQGIFISNDLNFGTGIIHLFGEGSFIAWNGVALGRDLADDTIQPAMTFTFRPDLIINAPDYVKNVYYPRWQQVPG